MTVSERELLQTMDFEEMSADEIDAAKRAIAKMQLLITRSDPPLPGQHATGTSTCGEPCARRFGLARTHTVEIP